MNSVPAERTKKEFKGMKKYRNIPLSNAIAGDIFYREFTKLRGYTGVTMLGKVHTHLFLLGMLYF